MDIHEEFQTAAENFRKAVDRLMKVTTGFPCESDEVIDAALIEFKKTDSTYKEVLERLNNRFKHHDNEK